MDRWMDLSQTPLLFAFIPKEGKTENPFPASHLFTSTWMRLVIQQQRRSLNTTVTCLLRETVQLLCDDGVKLNANIKKCARAQKKLALNFLSLSLSLNRHTYLLTIVPNNTKWIGENIGVLNTSICVYIFPLTFVFFISFDYFYRQYRKGEPRMERWVAIQS